MATAKKTTAKKTTAKKTTAKKTTASRSPAKQTATRKAPAEEAPAKKRSGPQIAEAASRELLALVGKTAEGISGLQRTDDGWTVQVEVLELSRVPNTTDVLASYEVEVDREGELIGYRRLRRYVRGTPGEE